MLDAFPEVLPGSARVLSWAEYLSGCGAQLLGPIILRLSMSYAFALVWSPDYTGPQLKREH